MFATFRNPPPVIAARDYMKTIGHLTIESEALVANSLWSHWSSIDRPIGACPGKPGDRGAPFREPIGHSTSVRTEPGRKEGENGAPFMEYMRFPFRV